MHGYCMKKNHNFTGRKGNGKLIVHWNSKTKKNKSTIRQKISNYRDAAQLKSRANGFLP